MGKGMRKIRKGGRAMEERGNRGSVRKLNGKYGLIWAKKDSS